MNVLDGGTGNNILFNAIIAHSLLSPMMQSSFVTTAATLGVSPPTEPHSALLAHPHAG
jgi:hypothetical protein